MTRPSVTTKRGDKGETRDYRGDTVPKTATTVQISGEIDELCALLGMYLAGGEIASDLWPTINMHLIAAQMDLFKIGINPDDERLESSTKELERCMLLMEAVLEPQTSFILPRGRFFHAATVARRVERTLCKHRPSPYLNRLSDFLFVLGRFEAKLRKFPQINVDHAKMK